MKAARIVIGFLVILSILLPFCVMGQRKKVPNMPEYDLAKFHFGFVLGGSLSYVTLRPIADLSSTIFTGTYLPTDLGPYTMSARVLSITSTPVPGFVVSILANMRMGNNFDLRFIPSLAFGDRTLIYNIETTSALPGVKTPTKENVVINKKVPSTYINFPIEVRYKAFRYNNFRPYLLVGAQYTLDLASQAKKREAKSSTEKIVKFNQNDFYAEAGVGFDFYNEWFKFGVELKMMYGFTDILKREDNIYTDSIDRLNSKIFQLSLTFE
ncbi:MAG: outer membrane beta-barrel protein [Bacteroidota bacterium]